MPVTYDTAGRVAILTLNRPEARNAINQEMADAIEAAIDRFEDPDAATTQGSGIGEDGGGRFGKGRFPSDHFAVTATLERAEASL